MPFHGHYSDPKLWYFVKVLSMGQADLLKNSYSIRPCAKPKSLETTAQKIYERNSLTSWHKITTWRVDMPINQSINQKLLFIYKAGVNKKQIFLKTNLIILYNLMRFCFFRIVPLQLIHRSLSFLWEVVLECIVKIVYRFHSIFPYIISIVWHWQFFKVDFRVVN